MLEVLVPSGGINDSGAMGLPCAVDNVLPLPLSLSLP
jgi:hypothetical protein